MADDVRPGLLRHRDDGRRLLALRHRPLRRRRLPGHAAPGRPDDRGRHRQLQDGQPGAPALQPDARPEVRHRDGRLHLRRRAVLQVRLQRRQGRRSGGAGGRLRSRLPAAARGAARRADAHSGQGAGHEGPDQGPADRRCRSRRAPATPCCRPNWPTPDRRPTQFAMPRQANATARRAANDGGSR